jgi:hypothetical protein
VVHDADVEEVQKELSAVHAAEVTCHLQLKPSLRCAGN